MKKTILLLTLLLAISFMASKVDAQLSVGISVHIAPPVIPVYEQPPCPVDGYLWVPGYWAWDEYDGYYWVPGYWAAPPTIGYLWTPGYWGFVGGVYSWHAGYWGPHVGYYGGINYGCGYGGFGYVGGGWYGGHFRYNTAVTRVNTTVIHNTYINRTVINNNVTVNNRVSYNGGPGGVVARPTAVEQSAMRERHIEHTNVQVQHQQAAMNDRSSFANVNHGRPATLATARPMAFNSNHGAAMSRPGGPAGNAVHNTPGSRPQPMMGRSQPMSRPQSTMSRPQALPMSRPQPQQFHQQPQQFRPQPQQFHQQPQFHQMNQPRPPVAHYNAPRPMPNGGGAPRGGGGGGEHHH